MRGYRLETELETNEFFAKFSHHFSGKGWQTWRWTDYEIGAKDGKDFNWAWLLTLLINLLAVFSLFLYWLLNERLEIRITKGEGSTYYVSIKGSKAKEEFINFADSIKAITTPTYRESKTTTGEAIMYISLVLFVIIDIIVILALL